MKKIVSILCVLATLVLAGCEFEAPTSDNSEVSAAVSDNSDVSEPTSEPAGESQPGKSESSKPSAPEVPKGTPTMFICPDGKPLCEEDVTTVKNYYVDDFNKKPAEITAEDKGAILICEGFQYFKEPTGAAFNSHENPELFDGYEFKGEFPENSNPWKRVSVGEEICGLKLKHAVSVFEIGYFEEDDDFDERGTYYSFDDIEMRRTAPDHDEIEFEGSVTLTGILYNNEPDYYNHSGYIDFIPLENKLPVVCRNDFKVDPDSSVITAAGDFTSVTECSIMIRIDRDNSKVNDNRQMIEFNGEGLDYGEAALVRVTLENITYSRFYIADFCGVEILKTF